jgi:hypothetical protein
MRDNSRKCLYLHLLTFKYLLHVESYWKWDLLTFRYMLQVGFLKEPGLPAGGVLSIDANSPCRSMAQGMLNICRDVWGMLFLSLQHESHVWGMLNIKASLRKHCHMLLSGCPVSVSRNSTEPTGSKRNHSLAYLHVRVRKVATCAGSRTRSCPRGCLGSC